MLLPRHLFAQDNRAFLVEINWLDQAAGAIGGTLPGSSQEDVLAIGRAPIDRTELLLLVGAVFGLTCAKYQSGEIDRTGAISRCGDEMMRVMLYEAAQTALT